MAWGVKKFLHLLFIFLYKSLSPVWLLLWINLVCRGWVLSCGDFHGKITISENIPVSQFTVLHNYYYCLLQWPLRNENRRIFYNFTKYYVLTAQKLETAQMRFSILLHLYPFNNTTTVEFDTVDKQMYMITINVHTMVYCETSVNPTLLPCKISLGFWRMILVYGLVAVPWSLPMILPAFLICCCSLSGCCLRMFQSTLNTTW